MVRKTNVVFIVITNRNKVKNMQLLVYHTLYIFTAFSFSFHISLFTFDVS